ncbi:MAG: hypothetical protein KAH34_18700, partial [Ketobacter sp.]|nr:hypothetical protein [Ketobacter sp.]
HLANALGARLVDTLYVLDEPTCGLHAGDVDRLINTLHDLVAGGNTVVVVEHDLAVLRAAEYFVELGPGAGSNGGHVVYQGPLQELIDSGDTVTAIHMRGEVAHRDAASRAEKPRHWLTVKGARLHNLRELDVRIPLHRFVALTGVSGSGKSSLMNGCLYDGLTYQVAGGSGRAFPFSSIQGAHGVDKVIKVDQTPIGKTSRSNPATYLQILGPIRELFAGTKKPWLGDTPRAASVSTPPEDAALPARAWVIIGWRCSSWPTSRYPARIVTVRGSTPTPWKFAIRA